MHTHNNDTPTAGGVTPSEEKELAVPRAGNGAAVSFKVGGVGLGRAAWISDK
jgi:hypothetical protein